MNGKVNSGREVNQLRLALGGDVMTGRGIDQILGNPSDPQIYESYLKDARDYVALAERSTGSIPRNAEPNYIWGDALSAIESRTPDVFVVNLETSVTTSNEPWADKGIHYRMHPSNVACLQAARIDSCVLSNNHVADWGIGGLVETLDVLHDAGITTSGVGLDQTAASAPDIIELASGGRLLIFSVGIASSGIPRQWAATANRPGLNCLPAISGTEASQVIVHIEQFKLPGDIVVLSVHWGGNWGYPIPEEHTQFAHELARSGAVNVIHGHSSHHPLGIEIFRGVLILYGCGDLINDYEGISGHEIYRSDLSLLYWLDICAESGELLDLTMSAYQIRDFKLNAADQQDAQWLAQRLGDASQSFGTRIATRPDSTLVVNLHNQWRLFDHNADVGVLGEGETLAIAFENAARAMMAIITDVEANPDECAHITCNAPDDELLLVDWLNALVFEMATRQMLFSRFRVSIEGPTLTGRAWGEVIEPSRHRPAVEIKGATLTGVKVSQQASGDWRAQCIVDV